MIAALLIVAAPQVVLVTTDDLLKTQCSFGPIPTLSTPIHPQQRVVGVVKVIATAAISCFLAEVDPLLPVAQRTGGGLRLLFGTPALNAGDDSANLTTTDLAGNPRKIGTIDLGAYEQP